MDTKSNVAEQQETRKALIRDNMAGVLFGDLVSIDLAAKTWTLKNARKIHYWSRAAAVEGVVVRGIDPVASKVTAAVTETAGAALVQVVYMTPDEYASLNSVPEWRP